MLDKNAFGSYISLLKPELNLYNAVHVHGVADSSDEDYLIDDVNPQFFLINVRCTNGTFVTCVLAGINKLEQLRAVAKNLATEHNWEYQDFTIDKPYSSYTVGTRIISIHGETSDTEDDQDVFTGPNAQGVISQVLTDQEHCFVVDFPFGVSVFLSHDEIDDKSKYARELS